MSTATTREIDALRPEPTADPEGGGGVGIAFPRVFSRAGIDPFDDVEWETRSAIIGNDRGEVVFEQRDVEIPKAWSQQATNIVVSKYFRGQLGSPGRERSVRQLIGRVVDTIGRWADEGDYFATPEDRQAFSDDLKYLLLHQKAAFNSPVWFQLRVRGAAAVLGLLHQQRRGHDGIDPHAGPDRGDAVQVRLGYRDEPVPDPFLPRAAGGGRDGLRPRLLHEGVRRVRRRHQVRGQDAARGQDGHPQRRPSRRARVHQLQGGGGAQGLGADRRRLRRLADRSGVRLGLLPELEQQPARPGRLHAGGARRRQVADAGRLHRPPGRGYV